MKAKALEEEEAIMMKWGRHSVNNDLQINKAIRRKYRTVFWTLWERERVG